MCIRGVLVQSAHVSLTLLQSSDLFQGPSGPRGERGLQGSRGLDGRDGNDGERGPAGELPYSVLPIDENFTSV